MDRVVSHWSERAQYDLETANVMLDTKRYLYVAYMCQQAIEKLLKAIIAQQGKENMPNHNLNRLAQIADVAGEMDAGKLEFLAELTPYSIEARYGDFKESLSEIINEEKARQVYWKTQEIFRWLSARIR